MGPLLVIGGSFPAVNVFENTMFSDWGKVLLSEFRPAGGERFRSAV